MTSVFTAALILNFGAVVSAIVARAGPLDRSSITRQIAFLLIPLGALAGFGAIGLFIYDQGVGYGLVYWVLSAMFFTFATTMLQGIPEGLVSLLGLIAIGVGAIIVLFLLF